MSRPRVMTILFVITAALLMGLYFSPGQSVAGEPGRFTSKEHLIEYINTNSLLARNGYGRLGEAALQGGAAPDISKSVLRKESAAQAPAAASGYSATNVQVEGVDEDDLIKNNGRYIYTVSGSQVHIVEAYPPEKARLVSTIKCTGRPSGLYLSGDRLVVISRSRPVPGMTVEVYDVGDPLKPVAIKTLAWEGSLTGSRMIGSYLYLAASLPAAIENGDLKLPRLTENERVINVAPEEIYYFDYPDYSYRYTMMVALNTAENSRQATTRTFLTGASQTIYASSENIYLAGAKAPDLGALAPKTLIHKISLQEDSVRYSCTGEVSGRLLNQFSMDEEGGYFRVATTSQGFLLDGEAPRNNIYVLDGELKVAGRLEGLAPTERIYSARFMGGRVYLVTFRRVDPLFVIDLKDPGKPRVLGELKIPGYSDYLHPYDENHLIGVGQEVAPPPDLLPLRIDQAAPRPEMIMPPLPARTQGVKVALFDVSDPARPLEISKYVLDQIHSDSEVSRNHRAFLFSREKNLMALPVSYTEGQPIIYREGGPPPRPRHWQGMYVFNVSAEEGIRLKGRISHPVQRETGYEAVDPVKRSAFINEVFYTVSDRAVKLSRIDGLDEIKTVILPWEEKREFIK